MTCIYTRQSVSISTSSFPYNSNEKILCKGTCANGKPCRNKISQSTSFPTRSSRSQQMSMLRFLTPQATTRPVNRRSSFSIERTEFSMDDERRNYCHQHWWQADDNGQGTANDLGANAGSIHGSDNPRHSQRQPRTTFVHGLVSPISVESEDDDDSDTETVDFTLSKNPFITPHGFYDSPVSHTSSIQKDEGVNSIQSSDPVLQDSPMSLPTIEFALLTCDDTESSPSAKSTTKFEQSSPTRNVVHRSLAETPKSCHDPTRTTKTSPLRPLDFISVKQTKDKLLKLIELVHPVSEAHVAAAAINAIDILEKIEMTVRISSDVPIDVDRTEAEIEAKECRDIQLVCNHTMDPISLDDDLCTLWGSAMQFTTSDEIPRQTTRAPSNPGVSICNDSSFIGLIVLDIIQNIAGNPPEMNTYQVNSGTRSGTYMESTRPFMAVNGEQTISFDSSTERFTSKSLSLPSTWELRHDYEKNAEILDESFEDSTLSNQFSPAEVVGPSSPTADNLLDDVLGKLMNNLSVTTTLEDENSTCEAETLDEFKNQCRGFSMSTGRRCRRRGRTVGSRSSEAVFCHQHKKETEKDASIIIVSKFGRYGVSSASFEPKFWVGSDLSPSTSHLLMKELREPISNSDSAGFIYGFEVENAMGYVADTHALFKVGRTKDLPRRLGQWKNKCGYKLNLKYPDTSVINGGFCKFMARAEKLIHLELSDRHKVNRTVCKGCRSVHNEWFCAQKGSGIGKQGIDEAWLQIEPIVIKWVNFIKVVYG